jgi:hypothetical protein
VNPRLLLLLHAVTAIVATGSVGHLGVLGVARLMGQEVSPARVALHARLSLFGLVSAFALGLLSYPHYRVFVRGLVLDRDAPWASNLFDIKENLAAFTLPLVLAVMALERDREAPRLSATLSVLIFAMTAFVMISGLLVTMVQAP